MVQGFAPVSFGEAGVGKQRIANGSDGSDAPFGMTIFLRCVSRGCLQLDSLRLEPFRHVFAEEYGLLISTYCGYLCVILGTQMRNSVLEACSCLVLRSDSMYDVIFGEVIHHDKEVLVPASCLLEWSSNVHMNLRKWSRFGSLDGNLARCIPLSAHGAQTCCCCKT